MKEASGEANLTVIAILLIAVIAAVATPLIKSLLNNAADKACCTSNGISASEDCPKGYRSNCEEE